MSGFVKVFLWNTLVGYLGYSSDQKQFATFEYDSEFMKSGIQIAPIYLRYPPGVFTFDFLNYKSFKGVPGFIADSLPDRYGNQLIDLYMAEKNIPPNEITTLDRLLYVADRGMGALEYRPSKTLPLQKCALNLKELSELAEMVKNKKAALQEKLKSSKERASALTMIRIGSSAGGARSKALIALSPTGTILDGTVNHGPNYTYWILKFDSAINQDMDNTDPKGMPVVEYIYSQIARQAGLDIPRTRLISDGNDRHFLIERFDRIVKNGKVDKLHYTSWAGMGHADRDGLNSYEQLVLLARQLNLGQSAITEIFRRAVFNILGRNQDDHTKNFGFLMDRNGEWKLAPAFDLTYSYNPSGKWTRNHQSWLNNKNNNFEYSDLLIFGQYCNLSEKKSREIIYQIREVFSQFTRMAKEFEVADPLRKVIENNLRLNIV
jgi:serine/threonine-protein kinase HipA